MAYREDDSLSEQDLQCSCCFELMVEPTTLNCGHSFCRFCLARWWHASRHCTCPECRQPWSGFPKVNIVLRKTIKILFPKEVAERQRNQETSPDYRSVISRFDALDIKPTQRSPSSHDHEVQFGQHQQMGFSFSKIIFIVFSILGIAMFTYQVLSLFMGQKDPLVRKSVLRWSREDVAKWLGSLGDWAEGYDDRFQAAGIDGNLLLSLSEYDLEDPPLSIAVSYHRRALIKELETLKTLGVKPPTDLWEYKAAYPVRAMLLLWGLREFPRLTVVYTFFFYHQEVFQPLLYYTIETETEESLYEVTLPSEEYLRFVLRLLLVPYYLIGKFTLKWLFLNYWVGGVVLIYCILMTLVECSKLKWLLMFGGWRELPTLCARITTTAFMNGLFQLVLWQFLPTFICDIAFYWMLFLAPYSAWHCFKARLAEGEGDSNPTRDFLLWLWRKAKMKFQHLRIQRRF
ncbi:hypothetical protein OS493_010686 [Desmophyllum pertusum]|uniref:Bifunctional apoptosis regulator n=1 Tax=Desmophyllum pertusum TaxID=174260 RepID=A0A9W9ZQZ2_9CNID|nr:hypothetical protein OS493_010686 [Desmophyllum pertusum]